MTRIRGLVFISALASACSPAMTDDGGGDGAADVVGSGRDAGVDSAAAADVASARDASGARDGATTADSSTIVGSCTASCALGAVCVAGSCRCLPGFTASGSACVRDAAPSNLEARAQADVCARWRAGKLVTAARPFNAGSGAMCDPGTMTEEAVFDAANRWNMYRWMVGLPAVGVDRSNSADMQQCSLLLRYTFRHDPPPTTTCYTPGGATAAGRSMICSAGNAAQCMDLYTMESYATDNRLSHRKIVVGTNRDNVNFGASAGGSCALYGYGAAPATPPRFVAIPNPGFAPIEMARSTWSLHQVTDSAPLPVANTQVFDETAMRAVTVRQNLRYAGINGWDLGEPVVAGHTYRVTLTDGAATITYRTTPVQCM